MRVNALQLILFYLRCYYMFELEFLDLYGVRRRSNVVISFSIRIVLTWVHTAFYRDLCIKGYSQKVKRFFNNVHGFSTTSHDF